MMYAIDVKWLVDRELYGEKVAQEMREQRWAEAAGTFPDPAVPKRLSAARTAVMRQSGLLTRIWTMGTRARRLLPAQ